MLQRGGYGVWSSFFRPSGANCKWLQVNLYAVRSENGWNSALFGGLWEVFAFYFALRANRRKYFWTTGIEYGGGESCIFIGKNAKYTLSFGWTVADMGLPVAGRGGQFVFMRCFFPIAVFWVIK